LTKARKTSFGLDVSQEPITGWGMGISCGGGGAIVNWQYFIMKPCRCFNCAIRFCLSLVAVCLPGWLLVSSVSGYLIYCQIGWPSAGWPSPWLRHVHKYVCGERFLLSHFFFCFSAFSRGSFDFVSLVFGF